MSTCCSLYNNNKYVMVTVRPGVHWRIYCLSHEGAKHPRASAIKSQFTLGRTVTDLLWALI